jgi:hypothetical protein
MFFCMLGSSLLLEHAAGVLEEDRNEPGVQLQHQ